MSKNRRKKSRCGHHLKPVSSEDVIASHAELTRHNQERERQGFKVSSTVTPYLSVKGIVTMRLVWRKREPDLTVTITEVIRFPFTTAATS